MSYYDDKEEELIHDTKDFLKSPYGQHIVTTIQEMQEGYLSNAGNVESPYPERYAAKYSALKEVLNLINQPIG